MFIPRPGAEKEDDGVVLVTVLNGDTKQSYLLMLDGETVEPITHANLPEHIPMPIHGYWSPDFLEKFLIMNIITMYSSHKMYCISINDNI